MKTRFASLTRLLKRVSRGLRLRFDSRRGRYVIEQRLFKGGWEKALLVEGPKKSFRYPSLKDIYWLKKHDTANWKSYGRLRTRPMDKFTSWLQKEKEDQNVAFKKRVHDFVESDFTPRMEWAYQTKLWKLHHKGGKRGQRQLNYILSGKDTWWMRNRPDMSKAREDFFYESP